MSNLKRQHRPWTLHRIHQWLGLAAALWLLVLGLTGFLLDHREWRWMWQAGVEQSWLPDRIVKKSNSGSIRLYQIDPTQPQFQLTAGPTGMWWSEDGGRTWSPTRFTNGDAPQIYAIVPQMQDNSRQVWLATDAGVWRLKAGGRYASLWALPEAKITALTQGSHAGELLGVVDRSRVFRLDTRSKELNWVELAQPDSAQLPAYIDLSRFVRDLHFARGLFVAPWSLLWSDISGIAMTILPLSGLLYWWLPRRWRRKRMQGRVIDKQHKQHSIRLLYRMHGPTMGLLAFIPIAYLAVTGILLDHSQGLRAWMKSISITRTWQPPVYNLTSWEGEIYGIAAYPDKPQSLSIGTRLGLFTSHDNGMNWQREALMKKKAANAKAGFIWMLRRHDDKLFIGGMGSPNFVKQGEQPWQLIKKSGHMPSDITLDEQGKWLWLSRHGIKAGDLNNGFEEQAFNLPQQKHVPWFYVLDGLHSGLLIHPQWKWVNDAIAVLAIILVFTGLLRWWRVKWL